MTVFTVKTTYPQNEDIDSEGKTTITKHAEIQDNLDDEAVMKLYKDYLRQGYAMSIRFKSKKDKGDGQAEERSPFDIAKDLETNDIEYKATLKLPDKGAYSDMLDAIRLLEADGFDINASVQLKENEKTTTNLTDPETWTDEDATIKLSPKASTKNIGELKSIYDSLKDKGYGVDIEIKPKVDKDKDDSEQDDDFANQLKAYPNGTEIDFTLKDASL